MPDTRNIKHAAGVLRQVLRHRLDELIPVEQLPGFGLRSTLGKLRRVLPEPDQPRGQRLRDALAEMGPVYVKLGQLLSTRRDLIPADVADELATLQDQVPPIADFDIHAFVSQQLGQPWQEHFAHIDAEPLASASIAQVHAAQLADGSDVVIKVVRPGIRERIEQDMALVNDLARRIHEYIPDARRLQLRQVAKDHESVLLSELSMFSEARNQIQLRRNFADSDLLYVPRVYPDLTRDQMLVMERVYGIPIGHIDQLHAQHVDMQVLAHKGVETFFTQVFEHNFFHADMHPGNILIDASDPDNPRYIALDCAIIGSLTSEDQSYLAQNLLAFFNRDYERVVALHLESGWVPPNTDPKDFEAVIREVCEPIFAKPLAEISFGEFVLELFRTAGQFNMQIQPQLVLLQKTLLYIEGLGRQLYPQLDLWVTAQPFMQRWATEHLGPGALINEWISAGPEAWQHLARLPQLLATGEGELRLLRRSLAEQQQQIDELRGQLQRRRRGYRVAAGAVLLLAGAIWLWHSTTSTSGGSSETLTWLGSLICVVSGSVLLVRK